MTKSLTTEQHSFVSPSGTPASEGNVALISMPWVSAWIPSIQLAILRQCLEGVATADTYEFFLDYAALISAPLYRRLCEAGGIIEEWLFAKYYFEGEGVPMPEGFLDEFPSFGLTSREMERKTLAALTDVTADFLIRLRDEHDWSKYSVVAFTLTIYQTASSFALARLIKRKYPQVQIVFGGTSCAGPAAKAMLEVCPYVDVAVRVEAEPVFAQLVRKIVKQEALDDINGITFRDPTGAIQETPSAGLHHPQRAAALPNYDSYFRRFEQLGLSGRETIWVPFESSRGCWWGEKSQCAFCGLHEIMKYRSRAPVDVLEELDWFHQRYGVRRFYATDLIMPQAYYKTFLPELVRTKKDYEFFYELKANVTQEMMATLAAAGVKNLQPGLESLSTPVLKIMKKGVSATQNVQFLKWAAEYRLYVAWNIIAGMPGEDPLENEKVARIIPSLYHLQPPNYTNFELDRFSPCYERPEEFGIRNVRPLRLYRWIFPLPEELLRSLIYRFEYDAADFAGLPPWLDPDGAEYAASLRAAISEWHKAHSRGARLIFHANENGEAEIHDNRFSENPVIYKLEPAAASLYQYLNGPLPLAGVAEGFAAYNPHAYEELGGNEGVDAHLLLWLDDRLLF